MVSTQSGGRTWDTTDPVDILHDVLSTRSQVGQERDPIRDVLELVEREFDPDRVGDGDQVQDGVGGTAEGHGEYLSRRAV